MDLKTMQLTKINGVSLEIRDQGSGEPVVFVHGSMGDECAAIVKEPSMVNHYRVIDYHRRGYGESECPEMPVSIQQQSADCRALLQHLGIERAHFVGQSYGAVILLQIAIDSPDIMHSLALLEPPLPLVIFNSAAFNALAAKITPLYESGDKAGAIDTFGREVAGADYRTVFDQTLPPGYFERWEIDADTVFQSDMAALPSWQFTLEDAAQITQPVLNMRGANTQPYFREIYETLRAWLPHAENFILPNATHAMLQTNSKGAAERLVSFFSSHQLPKQ